MSRIQSSRQVTFAALLSVFLCLPVPASLAQNDLWSQYTKAGLEARQKGDYQKAEELLSAALRQAENGGRSNEDLIQSLNSLAVVQTELGKPISAEPLLRRVFALQKAQLPADSLDLARTMSNLAECVRQQGKLKEAEQLSRTVLTIVEKQLGNDDLAASVVLNNLAMILLDQCRYEESEQLMKRSLAIRESKLGQDDKAVATVLNNLAVLDYRQGKYSDAESLYARTIKIWEKTLGPGHPDYALSLSNLAAVLADRGNVGQAETLYRKALVIREQSLGGDNANVANTLRNLAVLLARKGSVGYTEAENLYLRAIEIQKKSLGEEDPELAITFHDLAELYFDQGNFAQAEETSRQSLHISEKAYGPSDPRVATELRALSRFAGARGNSAEKEASDKRAQDITGSLPGALVTTSNSLTATTRPGTSPAMNLSRPIKDKWALVIGISNFKDPTLNLKYAAKDAIDFRNYLVSDGNFKNDHVKVLTDQMATRDNIVKALGENWLTRVANRDDLVVVYISSHGSSAKRDVAGVNMLVTYDTNISNQLATGIPMEWLTQLIKDQVHCDRVVLILDVCHSGAAQTASKGLTRRFDFDLERVGVGSGQIVLCSSQSDQVSWESAKYPNSVFTRCLIEGLRRKGPKTKLSEAFDYMQERVEEEVLRDRAVVQTPVLRKLWSGDDVVLSSTPVSPRPGLIDTKPSKPAQKHPTKN